MLWLFGGLDPTGGAGLLRDFLTARELDPSLPTRSFATAWTRQGHGGTAEAWPVEWASLVRQLEGAPAPTAIKVGLVPAAIANELAAHIVGANAPIVVDPVLRATDGGGLGSDPIALRSVLEIATLVTPNLPEARALLAALAGRVLECPDDPGEHAKHLRAELRRSAVLVKGGHSLEGGVVVDALAHEQGITTWVRPRHPGPDIRGTGCALATGIAHGLASHRSLIDAVGHSIAWLDERRQRATVVPGDGTFLG